MDQKPDNFLMLRMVTCTSSSFSLLK